MSMYMYHTLQNGQTLLHRAAESGDTDAVQLLIKDQFDVNSQIFHVWVCILYTLMSLHLITVEEG